MTPPQQPALTNKLRRRDGIHEAPGAENYKWYLSFFCGGGRSLYFGTVYSLEISLDMYWIIFRFRSRFDQIKIRIKIEFLIRLRFRFR